MEARVEKSVQDNETQFNEQPAAITGRDIKRIAPCAAKGVVGRFELQHIEVSPIGLAASDGHVLCVINAPGLSERRFVEARKVRSIHKDSVLAINGQVEFVHGAGEQISRASFSMSSKDVRFPDWQRILPDECWLRPLATFRINVLKRAVAALERDGDSSVTVWEHSQSRMAMVVNEHGDLALVMAMTGKPSRPKEIYEAVGLKVPSAPAS